VTSLQEDVNAREVLAELWFKERALLQRGETAEAARLIETALDFMKREGLRGAPQIACAFLAEARRHLDDGDYRGAQDNFRLASRFDPALVPAHLGLALALLRGDRDVSGALGETWVAFKVWLGDAGSLSRLTGNGLLIVDLALCFGVAAALLLICLHASPALFHDLMERFPRSLSDESSRLLGWGLMVLPVLVLAPFVWLLAAWAALFFPYFRRGERLLALLALALLIGAGPMGCIVDWIAGTSVDPGARALIRSLRGGYDVQDLKALERHGLVELIEERRKGNMTERVLQATAQAYVISPIALAAVAPDPDRAPDRLSARWMLALAARMVREVGVLITGASKAEKPVATFAIDGEVRFANAADRAAFAEGLARAVTTLVSKYHDEKAKNGRRYRVIVAVHPVVPTTPKEG